MPYLANKALNLVQFSIQNKYSAAIAECLEPKNQTGNIEGSPLRDQQRLLYYCTIESMRLYDKLMQMRATHARHGQGSD